MNIVRVFEGNQEAVDSMVAEGAQEIPLEGYTYAEGDWLILVKDYGDNKPLSCFMALDDSQWEFLAKTIVIDTIQFFGGPERLRLYKLTEELALILDSQL